ncbi:MAG: hypothetical protein K6V73_07700 [Firmicutes bacterium]|nr:hypothetical protein [Bacillota bacterium]
MTGGTSTRYGLTSAGSGVVALGSVGQTVVGAQTETTSIYNSNGQLVGVNQQTYNVPNGGNTTNTSSFNFGALGNVGATPPSGGNPAPPPGGGSGTPAPPPAGGGGSSIGTPAPPGGGAGIGTFTPTGGGNGLAGGGTGTPSGSGGSSGGGTPPALTFAIYPTVVLTDQPQVNSAAYGETLLAGVWAPAGYTITSVSMSFGDPRGDVNGQAPATICMGTPPGGGCQATVPEPTWSYHGDVAAARFTEDWNSYYGFWDPSIGAGSNVNRTPDTFPVYATVTTAAPDGTTSTQTVEIPQFELMSSLTYPRVGPLEPIQDLSPVLAQAQGGTYVAGSNGAAFGGGNANGQAAQDHSAGTGGFIVSVTNAVASAWNWMMQTLGFSSGSDLPPGAAVSVTRANG